MSEGDVTTDEVTFRADPGEFIDYVRVGHVACRAQVTSSSNADRDVVVAMSGSGHVEHSGSRSPVSPGTNVSVPEGVPYTITAGESALYVQIFGVSQTLESAQ